jgi:predicted RNA binding protein YcfA (HicA-like mRNA interferase family)
LRYAELVRKLRRLGIELYRQGKGSHEVWWWPEKRRRTTIPRHPKREIAPGTLKKILSDLGLKEEDLHR